MIHEYCPECNTYLGLSAFTECPECGARFGNDDDQSDDDLDDDDYDDEDEWDGRGAMAFCSACGGDSGTGAFCPHCGAAQAGRSTLPPPNVGPQTPPPPPGGYRPPGQVGFPPAAYPNAPQPSGKKIAAGLCGILLGALGIHKFVLGYTAEGIIMLVLGLISCGLITGIIGLIEGIIYLTKSDAEFDATYVYNKRGWF